MKKSDGILISEVFGPTLQGEGALVGRPTIFVRTGGCDFRCTWCDSMHAVDMAQRKNWRDLDTAELWREVNVLAGGIPILITISGGNPALQPLEEFIDQAHHCKYTVAMETQGSISKPWFAKLDHLILSPKPPSSLMPFRETRLHDCVEAALTRSYRFDGYPGPKTSFKVVVMTENDYHFAKMICERFTRPLRLPFFITPGNHTPPPGSQYNVNNHEFDSEGVMARTRWLVDRIRDDRWYDVSIIPQLHTLIWGNQQGV